MASRIKGITIEIGGDTSSLQASLRGVDKQLKDTQSKLKDVNKLLKLDPSNVELLRQKQQALKDAIKQTSDRLEELKKVSKDSVSPEEWDSIQREIIATEQDLKSLKKQLKEFGSVAAQQIQAAGQKMQDFGGKIEAAGRALQPLSTAAAAVVTALVGVGYNAVKSADELNTLSQQTGISTDELQKMQYASELVDVSLEDITGAMKKMKGNMTGHAETWEQLGVAVTNADGSMRDANSVFKDTLKALSKIDNETERDQVAMDIFGKSADQLAGIIDDGGAALEQYGQQAEDLGLILSGDTLDALNETNDTIEQTKAQLKGAFGQLGATVASALAPMVTKLSTLIGKVSDRLKKLTPQQTETILKIAAVVAALAPVVTVVGRVVRVMGNLVTGVGKVVGALAGINPVVLIVIAAITALVAAGVWLYKHWDEVKAFAIKTWNAIKDGITNIISTLKETLAKIWNNIKTTVTNTWNNIKSAVTNTVNAIKTFVTTAWNNIKTAVSSAVNGLKSAVTTAWNGIKTSVNTVVTTIKAKVTSTWTSIKSSVQSTVDGLKSAIGGAFDGIHDKVSSIVDNVKSKLEAFKQAFEDAKNKIKAIIDKIKDLLNVNLTMPRVNSIGLASNSVVTSPNGVSYGSNAATTPVINAGTTNVTINVYASEGMDINVLADRIQDRFVALQAQRNLAYA